MLIALLHIEMFSCVFGDGGVFFFVFFFFYPFPVLFSYQHLSFQD